jgi:TRAP-type uncharacterized transport system substrate-binding protein
MGRQKIRQLTLRAWSLALIIVLAVLALLTWTSYRFLKPFPSKTLVMATGMESGSYAAFGELYKQVLARDGIRVVLRPTSGALENLKLMKDSQRGVQAGFVQGTADRIDQSSGLVSLGALAYTPLWVFYRGPKVYDDLTYLRGKRIAIGPEGSGVRRYSLNLLKVAGALGPETRLYDLSFVSANRALLNNRVDAIMTFSATDNQLIQELLHARDIRLMSMSQAEAYARRFPDLSHVVLPRGIINPASRYPKDDIHLLSPTTNLIVRKDLHPALIYLLLKAAVEIHGGSSWVNRAGEFPTTTTQDDPISEQAQRYYKSGASWLYGYLPFWLAAFVERLTLLLIPLGLIIVPLIGIAPWIYTWRNRSRYYPCYRELREIEKGILESASTIDVRAFEDRLDRIEETVTRIHTSVAFYDELFILREHIQIVRLKLSSFTGPKE